MKRITGLLLALGLLVSCLPGARAATRAETVLAGMTTREKVCQLLMPSFRYWTDEAGKQQEVTRIYPQMADCLGEYGFGGVILFTQNLRETESSVRLLHEIQLANGSHPQLLMAVDQEGGQVTRLGQGTMLPGNMALGASGREETAALAGNLLGQELAALGFQVDFAPVVDVNNRPNNPVIGLRSFSDHPETVARLGTALQRGIQETGVIPCLKHFPGHGDTGVDSHTGLPAIHKTLEELRQFELVPFRACVEAGAEMVMTAHIQYPSVETGTYRSISTGEEITLPATLSKTFLTDILRGELGFRGVIATDAMHMEAIRQHFKPLDAARLAIEAGADLLVMPVEINSPQGYTTLKTYVEGLTALVESGTLDPALVDAAALRVLQLKERHGLLEPYALDVEAQVERALSVVGSPEHHDLEWAITQETTVLLKNQGNVLPIRDAGGNTVVLTAYDNEITGMEYAVSRLKEEGKLPADTQIPIHSIQKLTYDQILPLMEGKRHVILISELYSAAELDPRTKKGAFGALLDRLIDRVHQTGGDVTVISCNLPYDAARYQAADAILLAWSAKAMSEDPRVAVGPTKQYGPAMPAALCLALTPYPGPQGKLPLDLPALDGEYRYSQEVLYPRGAGLAYPGTYSSFSDLDQNGWYREGVSAALERGLMNGVEEGRFAPEKPLTRSMICAMLWRLEGRPAGTAPLTETDLDPDSWYAGAVRWAKSAGIMQGYGDSTFGPNEPLTREQMATVLYRHTALHGAATQSGDLSRHSDAALVSPWARDAVAWALRGILTGTPDGRLDPQGETTRVQAAVMLARYLDTMG